MRGSPSQCGRELMQRRKETQKLCKAAMKTEIAAAKKFAMSMSKGAYSSLQLARMNHPYATRNPRPPAPPQLINRQSGAFLNAFRVSSTLTASRMVATLVNTSPEAKFLVSGTKNMIARPIDKATRYLIEPRFRLAIQDAIRKGMKI